MANVWRAYLRVLHKHPWKTQAAQTGVIMGLGELSAQLLVERKPVSEVEPERIMHFSVLGVTLVGPALHKWYHTLDHFIKPSGRAGLYKVMLDQTLFAPALLASFLGLHGLLQKRTIEDLKHMYQNHYFSIIKAGWTFWPAAQLVNFYLIPFQHRVFFVNICALFWNTYLATQINKASQSSKTALKEV